MGPLVENLHSFGYTDHNLVACPYDWRLAPHALEDRDKYFTELKTTFEELVKRNNSPAVVLCHSMGNRIFHYFLNRMKSQPNGQEWIDKHVHTFLAVGAPWLGAPKALRTVVSGERMGMEAFLDERQGVQFCQSLGSSPLIQPIGYQHHNFFPSSIPAYCHVITVKGIKGPEALPVEANQAILGSGPGGPNVLNIQNKWYINDPYFGGTPEAILQAPPVKRLTHVYGINLETEKFFFYRTHPVSGFLQIDSNYNANSWFDGYVIKNGIAYETENTRQRTVKEYIGVNGHCSGDGTVPYDSLSYCYTWKEKIPELKVVELPGAEHRDIVSSTDFFKILINLVGEKIESPNIHAMIENQPQLQPVFTSSNPSAPTTTSNPSAFLPYTTSNPTISPISTISVTTPEVDQTKPENSVVNSPRINTNNQAEGIPGVPSETPTIPTPTTSPTSTNGPPPSGSSGVPTPTTSPTSTNGPPPMYHTPVITSGPPPQLPFVQNPPPGTPLMSSPYPQHPGIPLAGPAGSQTFYPGQFRQSASQRGPTQQFSGQPGYYGPPPGPQGTYVTPQGPQGSYGHAPGPQGPYSPSPGPQGPYAPAPGPHAPPGQYAPGQGPYAPGPYATAAPPGQPQSYAPYNPYAQGHPMYGPQNSQGQIQQGQNNSQNQGIPMYGTPNSQQQGQNSQNQGPPVMYSQQQGQNNQNQGHPVMNSQQQGQVQQNNQNQGPPAYGAQPQQGQNQNQSQINQTPQNQGPPPYVSSPTSTNNSQNSNTPADQSSAQTQIGNSTTGGSGNSQPINNAVPSQQPVGTVPQQPVGTIPPNTVGIPPQQVGPVPPNQIPGGGAYYSGGAQPSYPYPYPQNHHQNFPQQPPTNQGGQMAHFPNYHHFHQHQQLQTFFVPYPQNRQISGQNPSQNQQPGQQQTPNQNQQNAPQPNPAQNTQGSLPPSAVNASPVSPTQPQVEQTAGQNQPQSNPQTAATTDQVESTDPPPVVPQ